MEVKAALKVGAKVRADKTLDKENYDLFDLKNEV